MIEFYKSYHFRDPTFTSILAIDNETKNASGLKISVYDWMTQFKYARIYNKKICPIDKFGFNW